MIQIIQRLFIASLLATLSLAATSLGCFSSLPSSYSKSSTYQYQSSSHCATTCSDYSYFALTEGGTCICGSDAPDSSDSSSSCDTACFGYGQETCGGSSAYNVYSNGDVVSVSSSSSPSSAVGTTSGAKSSVSSATTSSATTASTSTEGTTTSTTQASASSSTTSAVSTQEISGSTVVIYSTIAVSVAPTVTKTVASTAIATASTSSSAASASASASSGSGHKKTSVIGPAVGGAVGGIVAISLIAILIVFFKRRHNKSAKDAELADSAYFSALKRDGTIHQSTMSHQRQISNPFASKEDETAMVDQRLNPVMLGRRRISEGSLADEADYSRKILRVANPDDEL